MGTRASIAAADPRHQTPRPGAPSRYAKLTRPRLHEALPRRRLFALLDALRRDAPVLWIAGPPGAGKTTLAASYLAQAGAPSLWFQVDAGDADPATLFFFLDEALRSMDDGRADGRIESQPGPGPERAGDPEGMARMVFRDFYARLPAGAIVVFDNVHEFDWLSAGALLECALSEVPEGTTVLAISRDAPPPRLARMELGGRLARVGWDALRLDEEEARALAQLDVLEAGDASDVSMGAWLDLVDGWAAGVVMLRNLGGIGQAGGPIGTLDGREAVFRYFAGEIFERMPPSSQRLLLLLSCLPGATAADAELLSGDADAVRLLDRLYYHRLFVERRGSGACSYHFHPLFGEFLRHRARAQLAPGERRALLERAAGIVEGHGRSDEAAALYRDAGAHAGLARLLLRSAAGMMAGGRGQAWRLWMSWLPVEVAEAEPWLWYWHGVSLADVRPLHARKILMRAERAFHKAGELEACLMAVAAIVDSYDAEWSDFSALSHWAARMAEGLGALDPRMLEPRADLVLHSRLLVALLHATPDSPLLASCVERVTLNLQLVDDPVEQLGAAACLLRYFDAQGDSARAAALVLDLSTLADDPAISPFHRVRWYGRVARWYNREGHFQQAQRITGSAKRIVASFELDPLLFQSLEVHHLLGTGELAAARKLLDEVRPALPASRRLDLVEWNALEAQWLALSGDFASALHAAAETLRLSAQAGMPASQCARFEAHLGACHAWAGHFEQAAHCYGRALGAAFRMHGVLLREERQFIEADAHALRGRPSAALGLLRAALASHRARQATALFAMVPVLAARLAALALEHGIEPAHVRAIVVRQRLAAPHRAAPNWPWPVAVRTLGPFELALHGALVSASGKAQQRPLALLKNLVAAGEGGKAQGALVAQLWGNADVAKSALNVTVHRLRKLLQNDEVIVVSGGRIALDEAKVWCDLAALGDLCGEIGALAPDAAPEEVRHHTCALLDLYRGPFCEGIDESWTLPPRERARNLFLAAVTQLGQRLEAAREWRLAQNLYQRALAAEPLAEANYRGWMRCAHAQDGAAAAFGAYRRCRETLSIVLGLQPAPETEKLAVALGLK